MTNDTKLRLVYRGTGIRDRDEMLSLTDMWRASGSPENREPASWARTDQARDFISTAQSIMARNHDECHQFDGFQSKRHRLPGVQPRLFG